MNLVQDKTDSKNLRIWINDLKQEQINIDLLIINSTIRTFPDLIIRRKRTVRQISIFKLMIKTIKDDLSLKSRV